jgi:hypothetical protein
LNHQPPKETTNVKDHTSRAAKSNEPDQRQGAGSFPASRQNHGNGCADSPSRSVSIRGASPWRKKDVNDITLIEPIPIIIISHPSAVWPGARHLFMHETGRMLAICRGDLLRAAAERMKQEGYGSPSVLVIRDANDLTPDITGTIAAALA